MSIESDTRLVMQAALEYGCNVGHVTFMYWLLQGCYEPELDAWAESLGYKKAEGTPQTFRDLILLPILGPERADDMAHVIELYWR